MSLKLKEYSGSVGAGETLDIPVPFNRSIQIRQVVSSSGNNVEVPFKVGGRDDFPADYVFLGSGFGTFSTNGFDKVQIINRFEEAIYYRFVISPDLMSDSRVSGSVQIANGVVPKVDPFDSDVMIPIYVRDFRTQNLGVYPLIADAAVSVADDFRPIFQNLNDTDFAFTSGGPISVAYNIATFVEDSYISSINYWGTSQIAIGETLATAKVVAVVKYYEILAGTFNTRYQAILNMNCYMKQGSGIWCVNTGTPGKRSIISNLSIER